MVQKKFSKDPKVKLVSLEDFLEHSDYLSDAKKHLWKEGKKPDCGLYYKITPRLLILIDYTWTTKNFGTHPLCEVLFLLALNHCLKQRLSTL